MYQLFLLNGQMLGGSPNLLAIPATDPTVSIATETDGTVTIDAGTGEVTITITSPAEFAGTFVTSTTALAGGPVNLVAPVLSGTSAVGEQLTSTAGLWVYDGAVAAPSIASEWLRDGVVIAGETGATYTTTSSDAGRDVTLRETATDANGTRISSSNVISIPGNAAFAPSDVAGLTGWWDASDTGTVVVSGTDVTQWDDKSGNAHHIVPVQSNPAVPATSAFPAYVTGAMNGQAIVQTDWTSMEALGLPDIAAVGGSAVRSVFVVARNVDNLAGYLTLGENSSTNFRRWTVRNDAGFLRLEIQGAGITSALALAAGGNVVGAINAGTMLGDNTVYVDGIAEALTGTSVLDTATSHSYIGRQLATSGSGGGMEVAEVVLYAAALSQSDREKVEGYLAHKWGLSANLDPAHPYKNAAP